MAITAYFAFYQAMPRIPSPMMFSLDPNDENLILTMPSEPTPDSASSEQDNTPKKVTHLWFCLFNDISKRKFKIS